MIIPPGLFQFVTNQYSFEDVEALRREIDLVLTGQVSCLILPPWVRFDTFQSAPAIPDAICRYCTVANLSSSIWCVACGAPLVRAEAEH